MRYSAFVTVALELIFSNTWDWFFERVMFWKLWNINALGWDLVCADLINRRLVLVVFGDGLLSVYMIEYN